MESLIARSLMLVSFILGVVGQVTIETSPENVAQYVGDDVKLICEFQGSFSMLWYECITKASPACKGLFQDGNPITPTTPPPPRYSVVDHPESPGTRYDLVITGVQTADGGRFRCDNVAEPNPVYAEVIVLGSEMQSSDNLTSGSDVELGDFIYLSSEVTFHGRWPPVARFKYPNSTVLPGRDNETSGVTAKYSVVLEAVKDLQGQTLSVEWYFDNVTGTADGEATNTPTFPGSNTSNFQPITVYYPPEDLTIDPIEERYHVGDIITCEAQGYPAPSIQWINMNDSSVTNCPTVNSCQLKVSDEWLDTTTTYRCQPCNNYSSQERCISQDITFTTYVTTTTSTTTPPTTTATTPSTTPGVTGTTEPPPKDEPLSPAVIGAIAACCAVVVAIIIVLIVICCMKKRKKEAAAARSPANTNKPIHGDAVRPTHMVNDQPPAPAPFPDEKVGYDPYSAPYSHHNYPDTEAPSHDPQNRNEEGLHYADLALEDVPRSRKPIQVLEPSGTEYAEIRRA